MDQSNRNPTGAGAGGAANTPPFTDPAVRTAADHQIPEETTRSGMGASSKTETEREMERTRDAVAEAAAPVMAEKTQEAIEATADRLAHDPKVKDQVKRTTEAMQHDAQRMAKEKMGEVGHKAEQRINQGLDQAADRLESAARRVDEMADRKTAGATGAKARAGEMAHSAADTMESVAGYLRNNDVQHLRRDLERQVREKPLQTLLIGVAAGWIAGKILR